MPPRQPITTLPVGSEPSLKPSQPQPVKPSRDIKRHHWLIGAILLIVVILAVVILIPRHGAAPSNDHKTATNAPAAHPDRIRFIATGDFIAHDSVNTAAKQSDGSYNYLPMMSDFLPIFQNADIKFCNDPILNGGAAYGIAGYPKFNSPTDFVTSMNKLGCNVVNDASNHSFDKNQGAIDASVAAWAKQPNMLAVAGENSSQAQHDQVHTFTVKGVKFAFLAYTTYLNSDAPAQDNYGVNVFSQSFASQQISQAKSAGAKIIIVSMRWGTEYSGTVTAEETADAQFLADQGVTVILGHGPHVLQPAAWLNDNKTLVWYSLGNFINTQEPIETLFNGLAVMDFTIKNGSASIATTSYLPAYMHYNWTAAQQAADNIAARNDLHMYLFDDTTQALIDSNQLKTTVAAQRSRIQTTLTADGVTVPLFSKQSYLN